MLQTLRRWHGEGWLRRLDLAMAEFVFETDPSAPASLLLATALVAHMEGRGHGALPLDQLAADPVSLLGWPRDAAQELQAALAVWPADAAAMRQAWHGHASVALDPADAADETGISPLVLSDGLLYLRRYWRYESRVAARIRGRVAIPADNIDMPAARALLDRLFGPAAPGGATDWQKLACALALRGRLTIVTGGPGTGKTHTAARLLVLLQSLHAGAQPLRVALAAPTGKAAARLRHSIAEALQTYGARDAISPVDGWAQQLGPARTLHSLLGTKPGTRRFRHDASNPLEVDVLFVDEASMVHLEMMAQLFEAMPATARIVLLGDKDQLASVEAGAVFGDLCQSAGEGGAAGGYRSDTLDWARQLTGNDLPASVLGDGPPLAQQTVLLRKSHRFGGPIGSLALAVNRGDAASALEILRADASGPAAMVVAADASAVAPVALRGRDGAAGGYRPYLEQLARRPAALQAGLEAFDEWAKSVLRSFDSFRVLCAVRDGAWGVTGLNAAIERALAQAGLLNVRGEWYEGRPVMVTRNDPSLGVFNGDIGLVLRAPAADGALRCWFLAGEELRSIAVGRLADVETAFAMTVHKSQGSEFGHVALVLPDEDLPVLTRELLYTGITRASKAFTLLCNRPGLVTTAAGKQTRRVSGLPRRLRAGTISL